MQPLRKHKSRFRSTLLILTLFMLSLLATVASAAVSIDTFNDTAQESIFGSTPCTTATGVDMIGGERDVEVDRTSGGGAVVSRTDTTTPNAFTFSIESGTSGNVTVQWDGVDGSCALDATGLGSINLAPDDGLLLQVIDADQAVNITLRVYTDGANYSEFTYAIPNAITTPQALYFPFESFTDVGAGADFTDVGAIELFASGNAIDFTLDFVNSDLSRDFGDLPPAYNNITLESNDGARHILDQTVYFGVAVDAEGDGQPDGTADGDSNDDGISPDTSDAWGDGNGTLDVTAVAPTGACVVGWIDWNGNDTFDVGGTTGGVSELVVNTPVFSSGTTSPSISTPTTGDYGGTYPATLNARFRIFLENAPIFAAKGIPTDGLGCPTLSGSPFGGTATETQVAGLLTGAARDGEVEDYQWGFGPLAVSLSSNTASTPAESAPVLPLIAVTLFGLTGLAIYMGRREQL